MGDNADEKYYTLAEGIFRKFKEFPPHVILISPRMLFASNATAVQLRSDGAALGLLQDTQLIETLAHFSRERIPERYVELCCPRYWPSHSF
jgi:hypothetical protein